MRMSAFGFASPTWTELIVIFTPLLLLCGVAERHDVVEVVQSTCRFVLPQHFL